MGCIASSPSTVPDDSQKNVEVQNPVSEPVIEPVVLKPGVAPTTNHTVHSGVNILQNQPVLVGVKRQVSIQIKSVSPKENEEDIQIVKHGDYYLIQHTRAMVDITTCHIIGELVDEVPQLVQNEYVVSMCKKYDLEFQA
jgi:hypothetical protein